MIFRRLAYKDRRCRRVDGGEANLESQKDNTALGNDPRSASVVTEAALIWTSLVVANVLLLGINIGLRLTSRCSASLKWNAAMGELSNRFPVHNEIGTPIPSDIISRTVSPGPDVLKTRERSGPEDDAIWDYFDNIRTHVATREDIIKLGKDSDKVARFEHSYWGLGKNAYMVQLDIMHAAFGDRKNETHNSIWRVRLSYCVDSLLQNLQCHARIEGSTMVLMEGDDTPSPDFNVHAKCRDFEAIREWDALRAVDKFEKMPISTDVFLWPKPLRRASALGV